MTLVSCSKILPSEFISPAVSNLPNDPVEVAELLICPLAVICPPALILNLSLPEV